MTPLHACLLVIVALWILWTRDRYLRDEARYAAALAEQHFELLQKSTRLYFEALEADDWERDHGMAQAKR